MGFPAQQDIPRCLSLHDFTRSRSTFVCGENLVVTTQFIHGIVRSRAKDQTIPDHDWAFENGLTRGTASFPNSEMIEGYDTVVAAFPATHFSLLKFGLARGFLWITSPLS